MEGVMFRVFFITKNRVLHFLKFALACTVFTTTAILFDPTCLLSSKIPDPRHDKH